MDWSEEWLRKQVGWQAFKRGKELANNSAVGSFRLRGAIASGTFKQGKRQIRCVVKEEDGLLTVECGCPANRARGEICEHAVALVLTVIAGPRRPSPESVDEVEVPSTAWQIRIPDQLERMLVAGRLQMRIDRSDKTLSDADQAISRFLVGHRVPRGGVIALSGDELADGLRALEGHPRIESEAGRRIEVAAGVLEPLTLLDSIDCGESMQLKTKRGTYRIFALGGQTGAVVERGEVIQIGRMPVETPSEGWRQNLENLCETGRLDLAKSSFLEDAEAWFDLLARPTPGWLGGIRFESVVPACRVEVDGSLNALDAKVEFRLGSGQFVSDPDESAGDIPRLEGRCLITRSRSGDGEVAGLLERSGWTRQALGDFHLRDPETVPLWLADHLPELRRHAEVVVGERLARVMERLHVVSPELDVPSGASLVCELGFQTQHGRRLDPAKVRGILRKGRRLAKGRDGSVVVVRQEVSEVLEPLLADLGLVTQEQRFAITKAQQFLFTELAGKRAQTTKPEEVTMSGVLPRKRCFSGELRSYQQDGVEWLCERISELSGALLGDEMGLGKTIQSIALLASLKNRSEGLRSLVLVPASLIGNWEAELVRFAPNLRVHRHMGSGRDEKRREALEADVLLTSYGTFQRDRAFHLGNRYDLVICDEATLLRNADSQLSRAVAGLQADRRLALSGTPVENRLEDLWSIFRFVAPGYLGSRKEFSERYTGDAAGPAAQQRLALRISPFYLRRTKEAVAPELPEKMVIDEWLDLGDSARELYQGFASGALAELEEIESESAARMHMLTVLLRLRQICLSPALVSEDEALESSKVDWLSRLLERRHAEGSKTLVFSQFAGFLKRLEEGGDLAGERVLRLDGSTRDRTGLVEEFQSCSGSAVFLISLKAGGYGLNLTAADTVVHMDPWWNPAVENQASDRAHRIGQTKPVSIYRLLARDTVEERVRRVQDQKRAAMSVADGGIPGMTQNAWSDADLRKLIG